MSKEEESEIVENMDALMRRLFSKNRNPATAEAVERIKQAVMEAVGKASEKDKEQPPKERYEPLPMD